MKIFHITDNESWISAQNEGIYKSDTLMTNGFIHCCLDTQLDEVLEKWFPDAQNLVILELDTNRLDARLVYENLEGGEEQFPHIYGPINLDAVTNTEKYKEVS